MKSNRKTPPTPRPYQSLALVLLLILPSLACARRYRVEGLVLDVSRGRQTMIVSHRAIPGYMDAMAMPFRVKQARELESLQPGDAVAFQLVVKGSSSHAEKLRQGKSQELASAGSGGLPLPLPVPKEMLRVGDRVPDFDLFDSSNRPVRLSDFTGKVIAINFIYTRCPLPEVCPRLSANFAELQRRFRSQMGKDLVLLSVTLDATYDTPEVLTKYAARWGADSAVWRFLTGAPSKIEQLAGRFGVIYWPEEGLLTHTSQTAVVGRDGRLAALVEGSSYEDRQLGDLIARQMGVVHDAHRSALGSVGRQPSRPVENR